MIAAARMHSEMIGEAADALGDSLTVVPAMRSKPSLDQRMVAASATAWAMPRCDAAAAERDDTLHLRATVSSRSPLRSWCEEGDQGGIHFTYVAGNNVAEGPVEPRTGEVDTLGPRDQHQVAKRILAQAVRTQVRGSVAPRYSFAVNEQVLTPARAGMVDVDFVHERIPESTTTPKLHSSVVQQPDVRGASCAGLPAAPRNERTAPATTGGIRDATAAVAIAWPIRAEELPAGSQERRSCSAAGRRAACGRPTGRRRGQAGALERRWLAGAGGAAPHMLRRRAPRAAPARCGDARSWQLTVSGTPSQEVRSKEGTSMARQTVLDLRAERLRTVWQQLPDRCRAEAVAIWTQLIMRAARRKPGKKGGPA